MLIQPKPFKLNLDFDALKLKPANSPAGYLPNVTIGDGNCVARSLSTLIFGSEDNHLEVRVRLIHEMVTTKSLYLNSDFLSLESFIYPSEILNKISILSDDLSNSLLSIEEIFKALTFKTRKLKTELSAWHLHAAAQILTSSIISLHPDLGPINHRELVKRAFIPVKDNYPQPIYILWTSSRTDMNLDYWIPNHVVPMIKMHE